MEVYQPLQSDCPGILRSEGVSCNITGCYYGECGSYYAVNFYLSGNFT